MIIGIDASKASYLERTGVEETIYRLILNFPLNQNYHYRLYCQRRLPLFITSMRKYEIVFRPLSRFWRSLRLPLELLFHPPDKLFLPTSEIPLFAPEKTVVMIHDLAFKFFPQAYSFIEKRRQEAAISRALKSSHIIFVSQSTREDFFRFYQYNRRKTSVICPAYDNKRFKAKSSTKKNLTKNFDYFLFVGRLEERKNILGIVRAFEFFCQKNQKNYKLVLAGKTGYGAKKILKRIQSSPARQNIILRGYVEDLADLYAGAKAFLFPSLYEGFGIPILEAFASALPVITSKISSLPEVAGQAAILVDPLNPLNITEAMTKIVSDDKLVKDLIARGLQRASEFSWRRTAAEVMRVIEEV